MEEKHVMDRPKNAFEIFKLLDKSNCGDCGEKTCLAFAGAVFKGGRKASDCPRLDKDIVNMISGGKEDQRGPEGEGIAFLESLKDDITRTDIGKAARRVRADFKEGRLTLKVMGKDFSVDSKGNLFSDIHINPWIAVPFLSYVLFGKGVEPKGEWVSFRELKDGRERYALFHKRCEDALKKVADVYTELFDDMVHLFGGTRVAPQFQSDISVVLHPLPLVPMMVCYWKTDEGMQSSINVFFDRTADENLDIGSVFSLGVGFSQMATKIAITHGYAG